MTTNKENNNGEFLMSAILAVTYHYWLPTYGVTMSLWYTAQLFLAIVAVIFTLVFIILASAQLFK